MMPIPFRYTLYKYSDMHWAIDCKDCCAKISNLTPNHISGTIIDKLLSHEKKYHAEEREDD